MKRIFSLLLALTLMLGASAAARADALDETAVYVRERVTEPQIGSVGGEWAVIGLARGGADINDGYFFDYYKRIEDYVKEVQGRLHERKLTEFSRVVIALTSIGKDPSDVGGYDLLRPLGDFERVCSQGINGPVFALIALDCADYDVPPAPFAQVQASRKMYVEEILSRQEAEGGFALSAGMAPDTDVTAMTVTALSGYMSDTEVNAAVERALEFLSQSQRESGGFESSGTETSESASQVLTAMSALGIALNDERFVKNGKTVYDALMSYREDGGFAHIKGGGADEMATEQALLALCAHGRALRGERKLYNMTDAAVFGDEGSKRAYRLLADGESISAFEELKRTVGDR